MVRMWHKRPVEKRRSASARKHCAQGKESVCIVRFLYLQRKAFVLRGIYMLTGAAQNGQDVPAAADNMK
jgi:hypothetical protein